MDKAIIIENVYVGFYNSKKRIFSINNGVFNKIFHKSFNKQTILRDINLQIKMGDSVGILGPNGCGKSTLLRVIAGIIKPEKGIVQIKPVVSPMLALGVGIELELSGYDNIRISLALSGNYTSSTQKELIEKITDFSELTLEQLRMPVKKYSMGMLARLSFSCVLVTQPELILIDEVLAVGDIGFQKKCKYRLQELVYNGATLIFVSHFPDEVKELCKNGICMHKGEIIYRGSVDDAIKTYLGLFS